jgi:hypothetical protein
MNIAANTITADALLTQRELARNVRRVFDYLRMTDNSIPGSRSLCGQAS